MDNNMNMFPEDPQNNGRMDDENDDIDFGDTLEDFENLMGTGESAGVTAADTGDDSDDDDEDESERGETIENIPAAEKKERPKLKFEDRSVSGIARGIRDWVVATWQAWTTRGKIFAVSSAAGFLALIIITVAVLNYSPYEETYKNQEAEDARQAMGILEANKINYKIKREPDNTITILTREKDEGKAGNALMLAGYMSDNFLYEEEPTNESSLFESYEEKLDRFRRNKENRIRNVLINTEGIENATVILDIPDNSKKVLIREKELPSASVTLFLKQGTELSSDTVRNIERMILFSVADLTAEHIHIGDGRGNILNIYAEEAVDELSGSISILDVKTNYERMLEQKIEANCTRLLLDIFPNAGVAATVKTNFNKLIMEVVRYEGASFNEETGETKGIVAAEGIDRMLSSSTDDDSIWGVVGTDANVDATGYYETPLDTELGKFADSLHLTREYLVDKIIEQMERTVPELESITLWATANGRTVDDEEREEIILGLATAAGISDIALAQMGEEDAYDMEYLKPFVNLTIRPFYFPPADPDIAVIPPSGLLDMYEFWLAIGGIMILIMMLSLALLAGVRHKQKTRREEQQILEELSLAAEAAGVDLSEIDPFTMAISKSAVAEEIGGDEVAIAVKEENLKKQIKIFVDQNPEIAAQLVKTLLKGEESNG